MSNLIYRDKRDYSEQFERQRERQKARKFKACKTVSVKIQANKLNATQKEYLTRIFLEAKWDYNARVAFGNSSPDTKPWKADTKSTTVIHLDKDGNEVTETFKFLTASMRQEANKKLLTAAKVIKTSKVRGGLKVLTDSSSSPKSIVSPCVSSIPTTKSRVRVLNCQSVGHGLRFGDLNN